jgi:hypothetical protein
MKPFTYSQSTVRVVFGDGRLSELPAEIDRLECSRALVLSTPGRRTLGERATTLLGTRAVGLFAGAVMHVPTESRTTRKKRRSVSTRIVMSPWVEGLPPDWLKLSH